MMVLICLVIYLFVGGIVFAISESSKKFEEYSLDISVLWPILLLVIPGIRIGRWIVKLFKKSKQVKKIILLALLAMMMVGCQDGTNVPVRNTEFMLEGIPIRTVVIDSCEYINGLQRLAHKGNCRFCTERRKQELKELAEELKEK